MAEKHRSIVLSLFHRPWTKVVKLFWSQFGLWPVATPSPYMGTLSSSMTLPWHLVIEQSATGSVVMGESYDSDPIERFFFLVWFCFVLFFSMDHGRAPCPWQLIMCFFSYCYQVFISHVVPVNWHEEHWAPQLLSHYVTQLGGCTIIIIPGKLLLATNFLPTNLEEFLLLLQ